MHCTRPRPRNIHCIHKRKRESAHLVSIQIVKEVFSAQRRYRISRHNLRPGEPPRRGRRRRSLCRQFIDRLWRLTLVGSSPSLDITAGKCQCDLLEQSLDVVSSLGARLDAHNAELLRTLVKVFRSHLALVVQVRLVADKHDDHVVSPLVANIVNPLGRVKEGVAVCSRSADCWREFNSLVMSYTMTATDESRM